MQELLDDIFTPGKNDRIFKAIFSDESDTSMMREFLNRLTNTNIKNINILNNELTVQYKDERKKIVDILVKDVDNNILYLIELNGSYKDYSHTRNFAYDGRIFSTYTKKGEQYDLDLQYVHIDLTYGLDSDKEKHVYFIKEIDSDEFYIKNYKIIEYDMDKIMDCWYNEDEIKIKEKSFLIMLGLDRIDLEKLISIFKEDKFIMKFKEKVDSLNDNEYGLMTKDEDYVLIYNTEMNLFKKKYKEECDKEVQKQVKQQVQKQVQKQVQSNQIDIAKSMLKDGLDKKMVAKYTNLNESQIAALM